MRIQLVGFTPLLQVFDMPKSVAFYRDILGFEVVATSPPRGRDDFDWGLLRLGSADLMLNTAYESESRPSRLDASRAAAHADTALFFGCHDVDAAYEHLRQAGVDVRPPVVAPYGMKQVYLKDPDGYEICLQWPATVDGATTDERDRP
jgi:catechol 2,3-dioxygenase-like lactoylglutathione lyase family enzyme